MDNIFYPKNIVVVGVSEKPDNLSKNITENILRYGYQGKLQLLGRSPGVIQGIPIQTNVSALLPGIDVAVILTPASTVPDFVEQLGEIGVRYIVIETAGFSEFSEEGRSLEDKIKKIAARWQIKIVGPNCVGVICTDAGINTVFVRMERDEIKPGAISLVSQSGGVVLTLTDFLSDSGLGLTKAVSVGNKLNLKESDYLTYFQQDKRTQTILMYLESILEGRKLVDIAGREEKPVIVYKSNTSQASAEIAKSHTAALSNDDQLVSAAFQQFGLTRVFSFRDMMDAARGFSLAPVRGKKLAVFSRSGGHGIVAVDIASEFGFELPSFPESLIEFAKPFFRVDVIDRQNPLDMGTIFNFDSYPLIIEEAIKQTNPDAVLLIFNYRRETQTQADKIAKKLKEISIQYQVAIAICYFTETDAVKTLERELEYPVFAEVYDAIKALATVRKFYETKKFRANFVNASSLEITDKSKTAVQSLLSDPQGNEIDIIQALKICEEYGLPVSPYGKANNELEAIQIADQIGYPIVVKLAGMGAVHKTDVGGIVLNVRNANEVKGAIKQINNNLFTRGINAQPNYLIQKMLFRGKEIILGGKQDSVFGAVVLCGLGGIYAEILKDINMRLAPIHLEEAREMLQTLKGFTYLTGVRGEKGVDVESLARVFVQVSHLLADFPQIAELDLNPVLAFENEAAIVDVRMILK